MSKWKAGLAAAALISLAAAFPAFAAETIDFVTLDIYMGITPGESGNNMGVGVRSDGCYVDDWEITNESGEWLADEMRDNEALLCALRQIGGWVIMGTYATVGKIKLKENGDFASCSVYCGIERGFTVWGKTYKQAIAKAINEQRRYFEGEVEKAREARHGA